MWRNTLMKMMRISIKNAIIKSKNTPLLKFPESYLKSFKVIWKQHATKEKWASLKASDNLTVLCAKFERKKF